MKNLNKLEFNIILGKRVRAIRQWEGKTLKEIGIEFNVSGQQWQKYESGKSKITVTTLFKLIKRFNLNPKEAFPEIFNNNQ